jgi:hypothetical protein
VFSFPQSLVYFFLHYFFPPSFFLSKTCRWNVSFQVCMWPENFRAACRNVSATENFQNFLFIRTHTHFAFPQSPTCGKCNLYLNILIFFSKFLNFKRPLEHSYRGLPSSVPLSVRTVICDRELLFRISSKELSCPLPLYSSGILPPIKPQRLLPPFLQFTLH